MHLIKNILLALIFLLPIVAPAWVNGQKLTPAVTKQLRAKEDSLKRLSMEMVFADEPAERFRADSNFVRTLVRSFLLPYSFEYNFDSVNISRLWSPDSTFRIFTWQLKKDEYFYIQKGVIQMNTPDGRIKIFPLFDYSMYTTNPLDSVRTPNNWIGAIYYKIIHKTHNGRDFYTLLGFDDFAINSNKKWMDILTFDQAGNPRFGQPIVSFQEDSVKRPNQHRFSIEYKKEAKTIFTYDAQMDMIVYDHLISETGEPEQKSTYIPDGDYEGFKWLNGQWVHVDKIFNFRLNDGEFPMDEKLYDDAGNPNEKKLEEASRKTMEQQKKKTKNK